MDLTSVTLFLLLPLAGQWKKEHLTPGEWEAAE